MVGFVIVVPISSAGMGYTRWVLQEGARGVKNGGWKLSMVVARRGDV